MFWRVNSFHTASYLPGPLFPNYTPPAGYFRYSMVELFQENSSSFGLKHHTPIWKRALFPYWYSGHCLQVRFPNLQPKPLWNSVITGTFSGSGEASGGFSSNSHLWKPPKLVVLVRFSKLQPSSALVKNGAFLITILTVDGRISESSLPAAVARTPFYDCTRITGGSPGLLSGRQGAQICPTPFADRV